MTTEAIYILLFVVATTVAILSRRLRVPYTVALVVAGLVLGALQVLEPPALTRELLFALFLPGLLFEAAFHMEFDDFRRNWVPVTALAVPGVVLSIVVTAALLYPFAADLAFAEAFQWRHALLFGAIIASTDPIAVVALFKTLGVPRRLSVLAEGESLLNDGTSIVFYSLILGYVLGTVTGPGELVVEFFRVVGGGALVGIVLGLGVSEVLRRIDDAMVEITLTTIAAYGSFLAADNLGFSGVIATVSAGMLCGNYGARTGMSASSRVATESFWEYVAFALNSVVFLLIGFELRFEALGAAWLSIIVAYFVVTAARALVVAGVSVSLAPGTRRIPRSWTAVLAWGGLRGSLSMVLALSLPQDFVHRDFLIALTFGVVVTSILVQGLTMTPLLRRLGLLGGTEAVQSYDRSRGEIFVARGALEELDRMARGPFVDPAGLEAFRVEYQERMRAARERAEGLHRERADLKQGELRMARRHLLSVERSLALEAYRSGLVGQEVYDRLVAEIDARLVELHTEGP